MKDLGFLKWKKRFCAEPLKVPTQEHHKGPLQVLSQVCIVFVIEIVLLLNGSLDGSLDPERESPFFSFFPKTSTCYHRRTAAERS